MTGFRLTFYILRLTIPFLLVATGCGLKTAPVAPESVAPEPVKDLRAISRDGKFLVVFKKPSKNADGSKLTDLAGFKVLRRVVEDANGCKTCPEKFPVVHDVDIDRPVGVTIEGERFIYTDGSVSPGVKYEYKVVAYNRDGYEGPEARRINFSWVQPPDRPVNLRGKAGDKTVDLEWNTPGSETREVKGFNIYRQEGGRYPTDPINQSLIKENKFTDFGLTNKQLYHYTVRAVIGANESLIEGPSSDEIAVTPEETIIEELKGETR